MSPLTKLQIFWIPSLLNCLTPSTSVFPPSNKVSEPDDKEFVPVASSFAPLTNLSEPSSNAFAPPASVFVPSIKLAEPLANLLEPSSNAPVPPASVFAPSDTAIIPAFKEFVPVAKSLAPFAIAPTAKFNSLSFAVKDVTDASIFAIPSFTAVDPALNSLTPLA